MSGNNINKYKTISTKQRDKMILNAEKFNILQKQCTNSLRQHAHKNRSLNVTFGEGISHQKFLTYVPIYFREFFSVTKIL